MKRQRNLILSLILLFRLIVKGARWFYVSTITCAYRILWSITSKYSYHLCLKDKSFIYILFISTRLKPIAIQTHELRVQKRPVFWKFWWIFPKIFHCEYDVKWRIWHVTHISFFKRKKISIKNKVLCYIGLLKIL